jgi:hypothetical protein
MIKTQNGHFIDEYGRTLILRGVNLGGSSKVPALPNGATYLKNSLCDGQKVSFVGRPFPLQEADEHFRRLNYWGFTLLRFLVTWEAVEHAGPGIYDHAYLDYLYAVVKKAGDHGLQVFIDPHQDAWSRFSGGDGAPGWTFDLLGMDYQKFDETGAAITHQARGDAYPSMVWFSNYGKLATATMFTLFFGGNDFAPRTRIEGIPVQDFLQGHFINAIKQVAERQKGLSNVVGFDTMNEPSAGYIGVKDMYKIPAENLQRGIAPTVFQGMLLGSGFSQKAWNMALFGLLKTGRHQLNPNHASLWLPGFTDIWKQNGVWDVGTTGKPHLLRPAHFHQVQGREVEFYRDYFRPFANRYAREIRSIIPDALIFVEGVPSHGELTWTGEDAPDIVYAAHWYDDLTLVSKQYKKWVGVDGLHRKIVLGSENIRQSFVNQIADYIRISKEQMGGVPTLIGEVGIPFDLNNKHAYKTGDFARQVQVMDRTMIALERNMVNFTIWNYTSDNNNAHGDQWNDEDFSIFSRDQQTGSDSIHDGGRALQAVLRPYARMIPGEPLSMSFNIQNRKFEFTFCHDPAINAPTQIFVPACQYPGGCYVHVSDGSFDLNLKGQTLTYQHTLDCPEHTMCIEPEITGSNLQTRY